MTQTDRDRDLDTLAALVTARERDRVLGEAVKIRSRERLARRAEREAKNTCLAS
jgi:hypothetical protein